MLNSTKTWQEEFDKQLLEYLNCDIPREDGTIMMAIRDFSKQFISDLRKRDMEALIGMLPKRKLGHINQEGFCDDCHFKICRCYQTNAVIDTFKQLIKDYYEN